MNKFDFYSLCEEAGWYHTNYTANQDGTTTYYMERIDKYAIAPEMLLNLLQLANSDVDFKLSDASDNVLITF